MQNNENLTKSKNIFFVGRLEYEKGIDYVLKIIENSISQQKNCTFHIFGDGKFLQKFLQFDKNFVKIYGHIPKEELNNFLQKADFLLMPSRFLETFWLSALEALQKNIPVIGFKKWWLADFISPELALSENNFIEDFFKIIEKDYYKLPDISDFSYENWVKNLQNITKDFEKILLVHDYEDRVGWAEIYVHFLRDELQKLWKEVKIFAKKWKVSSLYRKIAFFESIFSCKNYTLLQKEIDNFSPDLIWSHTVLRFIGKSGMRAIADSGKQHFCMHHDIGLFCPRPSTVTQISEIPRGRTLGKWLFIAPTFFAQIITVFKWYIAYKILQNFPKNTLHLVPSPWMIAVLEDFEIKNHKIFPHTKI